MQQTDYIIRGGVEGRERLRILSRVMQPTSLALLRRAGTRPGMACLDLGCGSGDLALDLARMVGDKGRAVGTDIDETKLAAAREQAAEHGLPNVEFRFADITATDLQPEFDLVHARFLLSHLSNPSAALTRMRKALRPGGIVVVEDVDFRGHFTHPECAALGRYVELYTECARRRGADANIGPRLPTLLEEAGFKNVQMNVVQPSGTTGEVKLLNPVTMENISATVLAEGLASSAEVVQLVADLYEFARTPGTVAGLPRIVEAWGHLPRK
jgi:ubiquinone/menaquinone biosynthesis C-methylase UbiE